MKHAIIGAGNLGMDLHAEITSHDEDAYIFSKSTGFDVLTEDLAQFFFRSEFDIIWYCVGFGSVNEAEVYEKTARSIHEVVPSAINSLAPRGVKLVFFSSDYAACEVAPTRPEKINLAPRSKYAEMKIQMETNLRHNNRPDTAIVRVGSLFGSHRPTQTFPGKIIKNFGFNDAIVALPDNMVVPTPTRWLAGMLYKNIDAIFSARGTTTHHCSPLGNVSVRDWGIFVLDGLRDRTAFSKKTFFDESRPLSSSLGCSFSADNWHWHEVWRRYFVQERFIPLERLDDFYQALAHRDIVAPGNSESPA